MNHPFIIGITGGSASGKTHFLDRLLHAFDPGQVPLVEAGSLRKRLLAQPAQFARLPKPLPNFLFACHWPDLSHHLHMQIIQFSLIFKEFVSYAYVL